MSIFLKKNDLSEKIDYSIFKKSFNLKLRKKILRKAILEYFFKKSNIPIIRTPNPMEGGGVPGTLPSLGIDSTPNPQVSSSNAMIDTNTVDDINTVDDENNLDFKSDNKENPFWSYEPYDFKAQRKGNPNNIDESTEINKYSPIGLTSPYLADDPRGDSGAQKLFFDRSERAPSDEKGEPDSYYDGDPSIQNEFLDFVQNNETDDALSLSRGVDTDESIYETYNKTYNTPIDNQNDTYDNTVIHP